IETLQCREEQTENLLFGRSLQRFAALAVHANDLLVARDDSCLERCDACGVGDGAFAIDFGFAEAGLKRAASLVVAADTESGNRGTECHEVGRDISGDTEAFAVPLEIDDGNGRFRREARGMAPDVAVEHKVADDADAASTKSRDEAFQTSNWMGSGHSRIT